MSNQLLTEVLYRNRFKKNLVRPEVLSLFHFYNDVMDSSRWGQTMWKSDETTFALPAREFSPRQNCLYVAYPTDTHVLTLSLYPALNLNCFTFEMIFEVLEAKSSDNDELEILFKSAQNETLLKYAMSGYKVNGPNYDLRYYDAFLTDENADVSPTTTLYSSLTGSGGGTIYATKTLMLTGQQGIYSAYGQSFVSYPYGWSKTSGASTVLTSTATPGLVSSIEFHTNYLYFKELRILSNICRLTGDYNYSTNSWTPPSTRYTGTEGYS